MALADGTPIWFELVTPDRDGAAAFYGALFPWDVRASQYAEHGGYRIAYAPDGEQIAGIMAPPPGMAETAAMGWSVYFYTADLDAALAQATDLGARTVFGPMAIPRIGRFAKLVDPQGVGLTLLEPAAEDETRPFRQAADALGHGVWIELATPPIPMAPSPSTAGCSAGRKRGRCGWGRWATMPSWARARHGRGR